MPVAIAHPGEERGLFTENRSNYGRSGNPPAFVELGNLSLGPHVHA